MVSTANDLLKFLSAQLGFTESRLTPLMQQTHGIRHTNVPKFGTTAMPWVNDGIYVPPGSELLGHGGGGLGTVGGPAIAVSAGAARIEVSLEDARSLFESALAERFS